VLSRKTELPFARHGSETASMIVLGSKMGDLNIKYAELMLER
jgi:hypothetical protein